MNPARRVINHFSLVMKDANIPQTKSKINRSPNNVSIPQIVEEFFVWHDSYLPMNSLCLLVADDQRFFRRIFIYEGPEGPQVPPIYTTRSQHHAVPCRRIPSSPLMANHNL